MMFKDEKDKRRAYITAHEIAQVIDMQIDEIDKRDGVNTVDVTYIALDEKGKQISIVTEYLNATDGKRYDKTARVNARPDTFKFFAQVFYIWLLTFANCFEHGVEFSGNV